MDRRERTPVRRIVAAAEHFAKDADRGDWRAKRCDGHRCAESVFVDWESDGEREVAAAAVHGLRWGAEDWADMGAQRIVDRDSGDSAKRWQGIDDDDAGVANGREDSRAVVRDAGVVSTVGAVGCQSDRLTPAKFGRFYKDPAQLWRLGHARETPS